MKISRKKSCISCALGTQRTQVNNYIYSANRVSSVTSRSDKHFYEECIVDAAYTYSMVQYQPIPRCTLGDEYICKLEGSPVCL